MKRLIYVVGLLLLVTALGGWSNQADKELFDAVAQAYAGEEAVGTTGGAYLSIRSETVEFLRISNFRTATFQNGEHYTRYGTYEAENNGTLSTYYTFSNGDYQYVYVPETEEKVRYPVHDKERPDAEPDFYPETDAMEYTFSGDNLDGNRRLVIRYNQTRIFEDPDLLREWEGAVPSMWLFGGTMTSEFADRIYIVDEDNRIQVSHYMERGSIHMPDGSTAAYTMVVQETFRYSYDNVGPLDIGIDLEDLDEYTDRVDPTR